MKDLFFIVIIFLLVAVIIYNVINKPKTSIPSGILDSDIKEVQSNITVIQNKIQDVRHDTNVKNDMDINDILERVYLQR